ncbi:MAG: tripartite tricarboxylate transporter permease [Chloroflexi bacterium]|nr:tripartite tricarboxylate transporter permease [Chloroflexota bacterium]
MLADFGEGLSYLGTAGYWTGFLVAVFVTVPIALIPGISATLVMAIMIPFIVISVDDPVIGLVMLATLTGIDNTLDSIPAILLGMPGGATQVTFLEGNQLAQRGEAAHTLGAVYAVSAIGGVVGAFALAIIIPVITPFVLAFGFAEIGAMAMFGVAMVAALSGGAMVKGIAAAIFGMLLSAVGPLGLDFRFSFEQEWLKWSGFPLIATTIGVFALPEIIDLTMTRKPLAPRDARISYGEIYRGARYGFARWPVAIRQSLFGVFLGAVPGIGSGVVDWMAYAFGIFWSKDKSQFGKGSLDGVLFAESAQNSKEAGQAVPTLALGIPGGRAWAFVIVAMLAYGIAPGPRMLEDHADITIMIIVSLGLGNLMVTLLGFGFTRQMARLTLLPYPVLGFLIIPISLLAAFQDTRDVSAIAIVLGGAVLGMLMKRYRWPRPPLLIGFILGDIIEKNITDSVALQGWEGTFTRPLFIVLVVLAIAIGALFTRFMSGGITTPGMEDMAVRPPAGEAQDAPAGRRWHWRWREEHIFTVGAMLVLGYAIWESTSFAYLSKWFPMSIAIMGLGLCAIQFVREGLGAETGEIMDIGIRSRGMEGARSAGLIFLIMLLAMLLMTGLMNEGLKWGAVVIATLGPMLMMQNKTGVIGGIVAGVTILILNLLFFDFALAVIWPTPFILDWLS